MMKTKWILVYENGNFYIRTINGINVFKINTMGNIQSALRNAKEVIRIHNKKAAGL